MGNLETIVGKRIELLRKSRGFSQETFADRIKIETLLLVKYEKGLLLPDLRFIKILCEKFGCSADWLIGKE